MQYSIEELQQIDWDGFADVLCPECGEEYRIEPDADFICHQCNKGRVVSPLIEAGIM